MKSQIFEFHENEHPYSMLLCVCTFCSGVSNCNIISCTKFTTIISYPGTIPDLMQGACLPCPSGNSCADPRHGPIACPPGTYSLEGNHASCTVCPEGYSCADPSQIPLACNLGELVCM